MKRFRKLRALPELNAFPKLGAVAASLRPPRRSPAKAGRGAARTAGTAAPRRGYMIASGLLVSFLLVASSPSLRAQANSNPTGPTGQFNGNSAVAGSFDPLTGNSSRSVNELAIAGAVSSYGLSYSRTWNSR